MRPSPNFSVIQHGSTGSEGRALGITALDDAIAFHEHRTTVLQHARRHAVRIAQAGQMGGMRALMLRLNCRLGPVRGSRGLNSLQIGSQGRAPHIGALQAFGLDQRRVCWIFNSP